MPGYVGRLQPDEHLDPTPYFNGPWHRLERTTLAAGETRTFTAVVDTEYAIFVMSGAGKFTAPKPGTFTPGSVFTIGWHASLTLIADASATTELFVTTLKVRSP
jgi:hypothetical protein